MRGKRPVVVVTLLFALALTLTGCGGIAVVGSAVARGPSGTPSRPLAGATVEALAASTGAVVARVRTAPNGGFSLKLQRGFYTVALVSRSSGTESSERVVAGVGRYAPAIDRHLHLVLVYR